MTPTYICLSVSMNKYYDTVRDSIGSYAYCMQATAMHTYYLFIHACLLLCVCNELKITKDGS